MLGGVSHEGNVDLLTPEQQKYLSGAMQGTDPKQFQEMFQKSFVDPAQQNMQRQIIPGIKEQFMGMDESGSSALNQALSQSATDLTTSLGSQYMNQYNLAQNRGMQAAGQQQFSPMIHEQQGILGDIIKAIGAMAGGAMGR
jgi:hypothetical protein